jgi:hypothetical protein
LPAPTFLSSWTGLDTELNCKVSHLALAWIAVNPNTSTVILGASKPEQVLDNLKALEVIPKLTPEIMTKIESILENKPEALVSPIGAVHFIPRFLWFRLSFLLAAYLRKTAIGSVRPGVEHT